ncbi:MAG: hypothetical protein M3032_02340 [Verrucomicrobiota bacterium]|nr:hypothetical protein [Verrucomicrobiota bacterium]
MKNYLKVVALSALAIVTLAVSPRQTTAAEDQYSFKVHNTTSTKITKLLASPDGKSYGFFDIGEGIPAGKTVTLNWDKKTNDSDCHWFFKAGFKDGEESEAVKFDFCEDDLELEF